jgi:hypothetical protein
MCELTPDEEFVGRRCTAAEKAALLRCRKTMRLGAVVATKIPPTSDVSLRGEWCVVPLADGAEVRWKASCDGSGTESWHSVGRRKG